MEEIHNSFGKHPVTASLLFRPVAIFGTMHVRRTLNRIQPTASLGNSIFIMVLIVLATGCSALNRNTRSTVRIDDAQAQDITLLKDAWDWSTGFHYQPIGEGVGTVVLNNTEAVHLIRMERPGHYPDVQPLFPQQLNPMKFADAAGLIASSAIGGLALGSFEQPKLAIAAFGTAALSAGGIFSKPRKVFARSYSFAPLKPYPIAQPERPPLRVEGFHMDIPEGGHSWMYFQNIERYEDNRVEFISSSDEPVQIEYSNLDEDLNDALKMQGFFPEMMDGMFHKGDAILLDGQLFEVNEHRVQGIVRYNLKTAWWLYNAFGLETDTVVIENQSNWSLYNFSDPGFDRDLIAEAMVESMFLAIEKPTLQKRLERIENLEEEWKKDWQTLSLPGNALPAGKVASALESVVTVAADDGHGSGCIISSNGYIVTNQHVVSDTDLPYTVYFNSGASSAAEIVRYHPVYDLALLKVDTTGLTPFALDLSETINVGEEAYAMGTPYDIDLGASVTKGIISGKRKDGERTLIQTDVSISPGNSGGALINAEGVLIGVVNEKVLGLGVEGIGFAIPTHVIEEALSIEFQNQ